MGADLPAAAELSGLGEAGCVSAPAGERLTIKGASVFVTGGSRGIGKVLVEELYARGAGKVYATARDPRSVTHPGAVPLALEVTDPASVAAAAEQAQDVTIVINNAGASVGASYLNSPMEDVRRDLETNWRR